MKNFLTTKDGTYATRNEDTGLIEIRDKLTDKVLGLYEHASQLHNAESLVPIRVDDGQLIYITPGIIAEKLKRYTKHVYSDALGDLIADLVVEGENLSDMHKHYSFVPRYSVLWRWRKQHPGFEEKITNAFEARAEFLRDQIHKKAREAPALDKDDIPGQKLAIETEKWLAEKDGPKKFSGKTKIEANVRAQVVTIDTGIRREGDDGYNKDYSREIVDSVTQLSVTDVGDKRD